MSKPVLTIGMIVKNEIRCLEKCLQALAPLRQAVPCELIIADTGSDDGTRAVAERYADLVFDFPWVKDFSAARNAVVERARGRWYLTVDADEYLDPDLSDLQKLLAVPERQQPNGCYLVQRNYGTTDLERGGYNDFPALRLFRLDIGMRYVGSIHERPELPDGSQGLLFYLPGLILHHDGYAWKPQAERDQKGLRNLELLDKELEREGESPLRLIQCLEAARWLPERHASYAARGMELLRTTTKKTPFDATLAARCVLAAVECKLPQAEDWIRWAEERFPEDIHTRVDTALAAILFAHRNGLSEEVLRRSEPYLSAAEKFLRGEIPFQEVAVSPVLGAYEDYVRSVRCIQAIAMARLGREEEALRVLSGWPLEALSAENTQEWMKAMAFVSALPGAGAEVARLIPAVRAEEDASDWVKKREAMFNNLARQFFLSAYAEKDALKDPWRLFITADGVFGQAARLMAATDRTGAEAALSEIDTWPQLPPQALSHAFSLGARFPEALYRQNRSFLEQTARSLASDTSAFAQRLLAWIGADIPGQRRRTCFVFLLLQEALRKKESFADPMLGDRLCQQYAVWGEAFLKSIYCDDLLAQPEEWALLPEEFALRYLAGRAMLDKGDLNGYVATLRKALRASPAMKPMAAFLLEDVQRREREASIAAAPPELLALAEQVRSMLALYPPDSPAVVALKSSPAYQQVAFLIEAPSAGGGLPQ